MENYSFCSPEKNKKFVPVAKKHSPTDLNIIWAIRDIPRHILNSSQKGILTMLLVTIGKNKKCHFSMKQLQDKLGSNERTLREQLHYLEEKDFIKIIRPETYKNGECNEYSVNIEHILLIRKISKQIGWLWD